MAGMYSKKAGQKIGKVMKEFAGGGLHAGSKEGPVVEKPAQAKAIALSEARKRGFKVPPKRQQKTTPEQRLRGKVF